MADIRKYPGVEAPLSQRELIGTIKAMEFDQKDKDHKPTGVKVPGYWVSLQLNAADPRTQIASQMNPEGGSNLNLKTDTYTKDGESKITHSNFYTKEQGDAMIKAAGKNVAPQTDSKGQKIENANIIAFKADLTISQKNGVVVRTDKEMNASDIESFGKSAKKAQASYDKQFEAMRQSRDIAKAAAKDASDRNVEGPALENDGAQNDGVEMGG